jgi:endoglycosylceramidase
LTPFYNQVASAIRAVDPTTPIFLEPNGLFDFGVPTHLGTVDAAQTVFGFDAFCPVSSVPFCALFDDVAMKNAEAYAGSHGIPAFLTSFGSTDNDTILINMMQDANQNHMGWLEWEYTAKDDMTSTGQPALVFDPSKPPVGDNVDTAKLATLAEPYPQLVAGTPNTWSFDPGGSDTFQLSYSTERADGGGSFEAGAQTSISVPAIGYPNGYAVSVTGGHVVSDANAAELLIASNPGANTVTVTVSAASAAG